MSGLPRLFAVGVGLLMLPVTGALWYCLASAPLRAGGHARLHAVAHPSRTVSYRHGATARHTPTPATYSQDGIVSAATLGDDEHTEQARPRQ
jgi:hypothetical protein